MASATEIKEWINEIRIGKTMSDNSILIQKEGQNQTRITLLEIGCCAPTIRIEKSPRDILKSDIEAREGLINHKH
jgi:hypothetical protein